MVETIRAVYERYGFEPVETPAIEYTDALGKFLPDQDRPNEGVFSFQDDDEQWLSLRYDLTAPLARYVAENFETLCRSPIAAIASAGCFATRSRARDASASSCSSTPTRSARVAMAADAEMCMMAADTMEALGIPRGNYVVKVNNRKVLDGVMEAIGLGGEENAGQAADGAARDRQVRSPWRRRRAATCSATGRKDESRRFHKRRRADDEPQIDSVLTSSSISSVDRQTRAMICVAMTSEHLDDTVEDGQAARRNSQRSQQLVRASRLR